MSNSLAEQEDGKSMSKKLWAKIHNSEIKENTIYEFTYPSTQLLCFLQYDYKRHGLNERNCIWLEYGCGTAYGLAQGLKAKKLEKIILVDIDKNVLTSAKKNVQSEVNVEVEMLESSECIKLGESTVDIIHSEACMQYLSYSEIKDVVRSMYKILRPDGLARITFKTNRDRYAKDEWRQRENYTYTVQTDGHWENKMTVSCLTKNAVEELFKDFKSYKIGFEEYSYVALDNIKSSWIVTAVK